MLINSFLLGNLRELVTGFSDQQLANFCRNLSYIVTDYDALEGRKTCKFDRYDSSDTITIIISCFSFKCGVGASSIRCGPLYRQKCLCVAVLPPPPREIFVM